MSDKVQRVSAAALARLLNVVETAVDGLAKDGIIPKPVGGKFELVNSVRGYINHLRQQSSRAIDQTAVARHLDMSDRNLRDVLRGLGIEWPADIDEIRVAYIRDLREKAAGRGGDAQADYVRIKIRRELAAAKKDELANHKEVFNLVPVDAIEPLMNNWATVSRSELLNAVEKMVAGIEGKFKIEIDRDLIDGPVDDAFKAIGSYPTRAAAIRAAGGNAADIGGGHAAVGAELVATGERSDAGMVAG